MLSSLQVQPAHQLRRNLYYLDTVIWVGLPSWRIDIKLYHIVQHTIQQISVPSHVVEGTRTLPLNLGIVDSVGDWKLAAGRFPMWVLVSRGCHLPWYVDPLIEAR